MKPWSGFSSENAVGRLRYTPVRSRVCDRCPWFWHRSGTSGYDRLRRNSDTLHHAALALILLANLASRDTFSLTGPILTGPFQFLKPLAGLGEILG